MRIWNAASWREQTYIARWLAGWLLCLHSFPLSPYISFQSTSFQHPKFVRTRLDKKSKSQKSNQKMHLVVTEMWALGGDVWELECMHAHAINNDQLTHSHSHSHTHTFILIYSGFISTVFKVRTPYTTAYTPTSLHRTISPVKTTISDFPRSNRAVRRAGSQLTD